MRLADLLLLVLALACASSASAAYVTVGDGCQYAQLQSAIDAAHGDTDTIHVRADYHGKPVKIARKQLYIYGGYPSCDAAEPIPYVGNRDDLSWLDGALDGGTKAVVTIENRAVVDLRNFLITAGHNGGHNGGGISFVSDGDYAHLETHAVEISDNVADTGAGIFYRGNADVNELVLGDLTLIHHNSANRAGGGLRLEGNVHLYANRPAVISDNIAYNNDDDGTGGGIQLLQNTVADIGSPGVNGIAFLQSNHAANGGGIALLDSAKVNIFKPAGGASPEIAHNDASEFGGGVYLDGSRVQFCMSGAVIRDNRALYAAALGATESVGRDARISVAASCGVPGEAGCGMGPPCNRMEGNWVTYSNATIWESDGGAPIEMNHLLMFNNVAGGLIYNVSPAGSTTSISTCNFTNNNLNGGPALYLLGSGLNVMRSCTIAGNAMGDAPIFRVLDDATFVVNDSIFWQPGKATLSRSSSAVVALFNVIAQDGDSMDPDDFSSFVHVSALDPQFQAPEYFNLRLQATSPAIDYAPADSCTEPFDLDGNPKPLDIPQIDHGGSCDIGAYEVQYVPAESPIFRNGFD